MKEMGKNYYKPMFLNGCLAEFASQRFLQGNNPALHMVLSSKLANIEDFRVEFLHISSSGF